MTFQSLVSYEDLQEGAYRVGSLVIPEQVSEGSVIHVITTQGLYGYLKILRVTDSYLKFDYLVYESTDTVLVHDENVVLNFGDSLDLDNDGENDVSYTTPQKMRKSMVNRKLLSFAYNEEKSTFCSFSFKAKGDILNINPEGNFIFTSKNFKLYEGITPSTPTVAFEKEGLPDIEVGDYIIDTKTGVFRKVVAKSDVGNYVIFSTEEGDLGEAFKILKVRFEDVKAQEMVSLNEDAKVLIKEDKFNYTWNASYNLLDKDHATITANINFDFNISVSGDLDIGWTGLDHFLARVDGSLSHSLILTGFFEKSFQKHGETDPFIKPKFTFSVYGIPVVLEIPVYLGYDFQSKITGIATAGYNTSVDFYAQIEADSLSDWDANGGCERNFERIGPEYDVTGSATLTPYLGVDAKVTIAEAFHPTLGVKPFLEASVKLKAQSGQDKSLYMRLDGGVKIDGEVSFKLFGEKYKKPKKGRWELYEYQKKIWDDTLGFPADPGNLVVFFVEDGSVKLQWSDNSDIKDGYEIYRKIEGGDYEKIGQTTENATTYVDEAALQEVQMSYEVRAFCDAYFDRTHSDWSNEVVVINRKPEIPYDPDPEDNAENVSLEPYLKWNCSDPDGDILYYYDVYLVRWEGNSCREFVKIATDTYHKFHHLENLSPTSKYCWKVIARDKKGDVSEDPVWIFTTREVGYHFLTVNTSPQGLEVSIDSSPGNHLTPRWSMKELTP